MLNHTFKACTLGVDDRSPFGALVQVANSGDMLPLGAPMVVLPFVFVDELEASAFLQVAERVGLNLWPGMSYADLMQYVQLWRDGAKR
jgi:hypothetical protein